MCTELGSKIYLTLKVFKFVKKIVTKQIIGVYNKF